MARTFVAPIGSGFGDVLISLPVLQTLVDRGESVYLVTRSFRQIGISERITGVKGELAEEQLKLKLLPEDRYVNLRDHPLQTDHLWGSPEFEAFFGGTEMERIIQAIAADFGIATDYSRLIPLQFNLRSEFRGALALVPGTDGYYKHWPHEHWLELAQKLKNLTGARTVVLGKPDESPAVAKLVNAGLEWIETSSAGDAIDVISSCALLVSVDTGLMHTAVQQGIPTYAFIHPRNYHRRTAANCHNFFGTDCPKECKRDFTTRPGFAAVSALGVDLKFDHKECELDPSQNCMGAISPDQVIRLIEQNDHLDSLLKPVGKN